MSAKSAFDEERVGRSRAKNQHPAVERPPLQPQSSGLDKVDRADLVALLEQHLVSRERSPFKRLFVERQHAASRH